MIRYKTFLIYQFYTLFVFLSFGTFFELLFQNIYYNLFKASALFELFFFIQVLLLFSRNKISKELFLYFLCLLTFIISSFFYYISFNFVGTIPDFLITYKPFFYLCLLLLIGSKKYFNAADIKKLFHNFSILFLIKYPIVLLVGYNHPSFRPGVFTENNFELMLFLFIYYLYLKTSKELKILPLLSTGLIIFMSGSRSNAIAFLFLCLLLDVKKSLKFFKYVFITIMTISVIVLFNSRSTEGFNIENIDRYKFLLLFINEYQHLGLHNILVGTEPITPVSQETASAMSYYKKLFSNHNELLAFSVVFHSFLLRTIFDHGLLGLFILAFIFVKLLNYSNYNFKDKLCLLGILAINGLSVSSMSSVYYAMGMFFVLLTEIKETNDKTDRIEQN